MHRRLNAPAESASRVRFTLAGILVGALLAIGSLPARACPFPTRPATDSSYPTIVLAEVVGVRLTEYADARVRQIKSGAKHPWMTDASPGYEVDLIPIETFRGMESERLSVRVPRGCAIPLADLQQFGVFYIDENGLALPVYQDDAEYRTRLVSLGSRHTSPCVDGLARFGPHPCWKPRSASLECLGAVQDVSIYYRSSCPAGVQQLRERLHERILGRYDWEMPPIDYDANR